MEAVFTLFISVVAAATSVAAIVFVVVNMQH